MQPKDLVSIAKKNLRINPFDAVHDERHHFAVWKNCLQIIKDERITGIDKNCLKVATWWHDVQRSQEDESALLKFEMQKNGVDLTTQKKVLEIMDSHTYGNHQVSIEAKILFDADKLEYVSNKRGKILLNMYKKGEITKERFDYYVKIWRERILAVRDQIHFKSAKNEFEKRLKYFVESMKNNKELEVFVEGIMI